LAGKIMANDTEKDSMGIGIVGIGREKEEDKDEEFRDKRRKQSSQFFRFHIFQD
jgi:hypothetical protein